MRRKRRSLLVVASSALARPLLGVGLAVPGTARSRGGPQTTRVAAIQFEPKPGDIDANLARAERLAREAIAKGAKFVVLPEFFPTGTGFHPSLYGSYQPVNGRAAALLKELAQAGGVHVCGSFMASSNGDAYNMQVLAAPDGALFTHDKDFPSMAFESSYYAGGEDSIFVEQLQAGGARTDPARIPSRLESSPIGAFSHLHLGVGTALCWEIVRTRTARRLFGKIDVLLACSGWWTADPGKNWPGLRPEAAAIGWKEQRILIENAPRRMARMLGVPVIHANFTGANMGYTSAAFDQEAPGRYLGGSQIVDAEGNSLAQFEAQDGVLLADINLARRQPLESIGDDFWIPDVSEAIRQRWVRTGAEGRNHYLRHTRTKLKN